MSAAAPAGVGEMEALRHQAHMAHVVLRMNTDGVTHEESLASSSRSRTATA
jgi:hypothetical protein